MAQLLRVGTILRIVDDDKLPPAEGQCKIEGLGFGVRGRIRHDDQREASIVAMSADRSDSFGRAAFDHEDYVQFFWRIVETCQTGTKLVDHIGFIAQPGE